MKHRLLLLFLLTTLASFVSGQILYDGMYSSDWEAERDALLEGQQFSKDTQRALREIELRTQEQVRAVQNLNFEIPAPQSQPTQKSNTNGRMTQAEYNRMIANQNKEIQAKRIQEHNKQVAERNKQMQIDAAKQRREAQRIKAEKEAREREETRRKVAEETYQSLGPQTQRKQAAAAYASGEGAYQLAQMHDVHRFAKPLPKGNINGFNQGDNIQHKKFSLPQSGLVIDPYRHYKLATWDEKSSDDLRFVNPIMPVPQGQYKNQWLSFCDSMPNSRAMVHLALMSEMNGGELPEIYNYENFSAFLSKDGNTIFVVPKSGGAMAILKLDESENMQFKNQLYAEEEIGFIKAKNTLIDSNKPLEDPNITDTKISIAKAKLSRKDGENAIKMKLDTIAKYIDPLYREVKEGQKKHKKDGIGFGVGAGHEIEFKNMSSMKGTIISFNPFTDKLAKVQSIEVKAGQKIGTNLSVNANTAKGVGLNASIGVEGISLKSGKGYMLVGRNNIHTTNITGELSFGSKTGIKLQAKNLSFHSGIIGFGVGGDYKVIPLIVKN